jgi:hypothetical protein
MYRRADLVHAYLGAQQRGYGGYYAESPTFNAALAAHHRSRLDGLQRLFGLRLGGDGQAEVRQAALGMLFRSAAESFLTLRTPFSGFLEAGLIHRVLEEAGEPGAQVYRTNDRIGAAVVEAREAHLDMLDALVAAMLGDRADLTFTDADARVAGIEFLPEPTTAEYPLFDA